MKIINKQEVNPIIGDFNSKLGIGKVTNVVGHHMGWEIGMPVMTGLSSFAKKMKM